MNYFLSIMVNKPVLPKYQDEIIASILKFVQNSKHATSFVQI